MPSLSHPSAVGRPRTRPHGRRPTIVLAALTALLLVSACTPSEEPSARRASAPDAASESSAGTTETPVGLDVPEKGACWTTDDPIATEDWSWWRGGAPVDCSADHVYITAGVAWLPDTFAYPAVEGDRLTAMTDEQHDVVASMCRDAIGMEFKERRGTRVRSFWYLPSPEEWAEGDRSLRCDVAVAAHGPVTGHQLELLPTTAEAVVSQMYLAYRTCLNTPLPADDDHTALDAWEQSTLVPCQGAQWQAFRPTTISQSQFDSRDEYIAMVSYMCDELLAHLPGRSTWSASMTEWTDGREEEAEIACWVA